MVEIKLLAEAGLAFAVYDPKLFTFRQPCGETKEAALRGSFRCQNRPSVFTPRNDAKDRCHRSIRKNAFPKIDWANKLGFDSSLWRFDFVPRLLVQPANS